MKKRNGVIAVIGLAIAFSLTGSDSVAQDLGNLGGKLGGMMPGGGSMSSGSMGNVAGLLQYCVKNNYLGSASGASGIKDKLLGKMGSSSPSPTSDSGYMSGAQGILHTGNGNTVNLANAGGGSSDMKSKITTKVCNTVLKQGQSFIGH